MEGDRPYFDFMRDVGQVVDSRVKAAQDRIGRAAHYTGEWLVGRKLTSGELRMMAYMFGANAGYARARIYPLNFWWPYPNDRAMTPFGDIWFPGKDFYEDFSQPYVPVPARALFMHEATHLYQYYALNQHVAAKRLWQGGNYSYELRPGAKLREYGIEQMGQIVQDYYTITHGWSIAGLPYQPADYRGTVPVRG